MKVPFLIRLLVASAAVFALGRTTAEAQSCPLWMQTEHFDEPSPSCHNTRVHVTHLYWDEGPPGGAIDSCPIACSQEPIDPEGGPICAYCDGLPYCTYGPAGCGDACDGTASESGRCAPPEPNECENWRADPVHVGTSVFVTEEREDVRFSGSQRPLRFARHYTSLDRWPTHRGPPSNPFEPLGLNRMAPGWFHTYDERLFGMPLGAPTELLPPTSGAGTLHVLHRTSGAAGQRFECAAPHDPASDFTCASQDGSEDALVWLAASSTWSHRTGEGVWTSFDDEGRLLGLADRAGHGWTVTYHAGGPEEGLIDFVEDHLGRRLVFVWMVPDASWTGRPVLERLEDAAGAVLATFTTDVGLTGFLLGATSAAGSESYGYGQVIAGGVTYDIPVLEEIVRDGSVETRVEYEDFPIPTATVLTGRVRSVTAATGSYEFRFRNESTNLCNDEFGYDEARTAMVLDRTTPEVPASCSLDSHCGTAEACSSEGLCRPFTCQQYVQPVGAASVDFNAVGDVSGNCPCGGASHREWAELSNGGVRVTSHTARDGTLVTFGYDAQARLVERCVGDADLDGDPSTCESTGAVWTRWTYDTTWADQVALEERRSRLSSMLAETEYDYDPTTGRLTHVRRRGFTQDLGGSVVGPVEEVTVYVWDAAGRLAEEQGPAGERTVYTYYAPGSGTSSGLVHYVDRYATATAALRTTFEDYTSTGRPRRVIDPSGLVTDVTYSPTGQLLTLTVAGRTATLGYDAAGRLSTVAEASGRRFVLGYDGSGRLDQVDTYDSSAPGWSDRVRYEYDAAGRRTGLSVKLIDAAGEVWSTALTWSATYDHHGFMDSETPGPQAPTDFTRDSDGMGYLESLTRGDGDTEDFGSDLLGRVTSVQRTFAMGSTGTHVLGYANELGSGRNVGGSLPTRVTEPGGAVRDYVYDDFGRLVESSSTDWGTAHWRWEDGRLAEERDTFGRRRAYTRDRLGRVTLIDGDADSPGSVGQDYQFDYDNGDAALPCTTPHYSCANRVGRLTRVGIEYLPGLFWSMYYDYDPRGNVGTEVYPDGRTMNVDYDADGMPIRVHLPARPGDALGYDYGTADGDHLDATELVAIRHERSGGTSFRWFDDISRDTGAGLVTGFRLHDAAWYPPYVQWTDDGRIECLWSYRRTSGGGAAGVLDRCYGFEADGMVSAHDSYVSSDEPRRYFRDGANRVTCAASDDLATSCPTGSTLVQRMSYDPSDNRLDAQTPAGTTGYLNAGNAIWDEYPPGETIWYYYAHGSSGPRAWEAEVTAPAWNDRYYVYDGEQRLSGIWRYTADPDVPGSPTDLHATTILYDHRSRPLVVADYNDATGEEEQRFYYWNLDDTLLHQVHYPDITDPSTYTVDTFVPLPNRAPAPPVYTGRMRTEFSGGGPGAEEYMYYASGPEGRPMAAYAFDLATGLTSEVWRAQYTPFGELVSETTSDPDRYRAQGLFPGQLYLHGSEVGWWEGGVYRSRQALYLNRWRVYDPRVGQYLQPEPMLVMGSLALMHPYAYALLAPQDYVDWDGRIPVAIPWVGGAAAAGAAAVGGPPAWLLIGLFATGGLAAGYASNHWDATVQGINIATSPWRDQQFNQCSMETGGASSRGRNPRQGDVCHLQRQLVDLSDARRHCEYLCVRTGPHRLTVPQNLPCITPIFITF